MKSLGVLAPVLLLVIATPPLANATLPKYGYSIPAGADVGQLIRTSEQCGTVDKVVLLPPWELDLAREGADSTRNDMQARILQALPEDAEVYARIQLRAGDLTGKESETALTNRITEFLSHLPLTNAKVRGLLIEVEKPEVEKPEVEKPKVARDLYSFALINIAVKAKGSKPDLQLTFAFPGDFIPRHGDLIKRLAFYADRLGTVYGPNWQTDTEWIANNALNKPVVMKVEISPSASPEVAGAAYLDAVLATSGTSVGTVSLVWSEPRNVEVLGGVCTANNAFSKLITGEFNSVPAATAPFKVTVQGAAAGEGNWFADSHSRDLGIVLRVGGSNADPKTVAIAGPTGRFDIQWYDPVTGAKLKPGAVKADQQGTSQTCACDSQYAMIFFHELGRATEKAFSSVNVTAQANLTVEEIIARWQQNREAQRQKLDHYISSCFLTLHFDSTSVSPGFDISMPMKQFSNNRSGLLEWEQTDFYVNGVKFKSSRGFPLPQLEPEKVVTQPLELSLNEKYSYKLLGTEQVNGVLAFVVEFEPKEQNEALYSGKVWIDGTTFRHVKMYLTQRGAKSNVVANVETQNYELVSDDLGNQYNLLASITAQQTLNAADRNFLLEKTYKFSTYKINTPEFETALAAARASDHRMYRETAVGLRVLKKEGDQRVVQENSSRVESIVGGAFYEGTYNFPIPLLGFSLVDFNYRNTGSQLSIFFAGPVLAANLSHQYGKKFRLGFDLAASGLPGENRVYSGNTEVTAQGLWNWEETAGLRATWQASTHLSFTASSYFIYDYYRATSDTDKTFVLPHSGVTLLPGIEFNYTQHGYTMTGEVDEARRLGWTAFGYPGQQAPAISSYTRYYGDFTKNVYTGKFTRGGVDLSYYGGNPLDRFSRYWPSLFSQPRIKGVPAGTDSFDAIAVATAYYGFNVAELVKLEGSYSYARARNMAEVFEPLHFKKFDGVEFDASTAGPWGTFIQTSVTYALAGNLPRYNSRWGGLIMIFKPLH